MTDTNHVKLSTTKCDPSRSSTTMTNLTSSLEERKRKSRTTVLAGLVLLLILWVLKLSHPQFSIIPSTKLSSTGPSTSKDKSQDAELWRPNTKTSGIMFAEDTTFNGTITTKAAVIIETRFRQNLVPLILHFSAVLGPSWPILIYTSAEAVGLFSASASLSRYISANQIQIRILPQTVLFTNSDSVSAFLTNTWVWESLAPAEHILLFQSDSMLCANAARSVDDYFEYDFIGAPIKPDLGKGYNGGLSLRKRSSILRVLSTWDWQETQREGDRFEDQWFFNRFIELQGEEAAAGIDPTAEGAINLPKVEIARTFSVETIHYPHPVGVHQVHRFLTDQIPKLNAWCPEYKLCSEDDERVPV